MFLNDYDLMSILDIKTINIIIRNQQTLAVTFIKLR